MTVTVIVCTVMWVAISAVDIYFTRQLRRDLNDWVERVDGAAKQLERYEDGTLR
jgi:hypothetical protein